MAWGPWPIWNCCADAISLIYFYHFLNDLFHTIFYLLNDLL